MGAAGAIENDFAEILTRPRRQLCVHEHLAAWPIAQLSRCWCCVSPSRLHFQSEQALFEGRCPPCRCRGLRFSYVPFLLGWVSRYHGMTLRVRKNLPRGAFMLPFVHNRLVAPS